MNKLPSKLRTSSLFYKTNHKIFRPLSFSKISSYSSESKLKPQPIQSIAPAGTILKGLNFYKNGADPIALPDDEYPGWLWEILNKEKEEQLRNDVHSRQYHRKQRRDLIKDNNFDRNKKK
ncbi:4443_t:CDS:2 [Funneliformis geosporum]|uniref:Large ribosomal subunit protein mL54 n=1 Tax=Funneliformis geosporum TaxID=1117311 RepID=A0A9W4SSF3_9GLOM|nr:4443_t:CDS:2 [Funneliformis geosporum]CAI2177491.1 19957_t:CDS:2 [Funneliformis geosporum]